MNEGAIPWPVVLIGVAVVATKLTVLVLFLTGKLKLPKDDEKDWPRL